MRKTKTHKRTRKQAGGGPPINFENISAKEVVLADFWQVAGKILSEGYTLVKV